MYRSSVLPPAFEQFYAIIEYTPNDFSLLPTDLYRQRGTDRWKRQSQWEEELVDPTENCTHIFLSGDTYEINSDEGDELLQLAQRNLEGLHTLSTEPSPTIPQPRGSPIILLVLLILLNLNSVGIYLILQRLP
jgi:hypothetical protein